MRNAEKQVEDGRRQGPVSSLIPHSSFLPSPGELAAKHGRVREFLERHGLEGVLLGTIGNFAWITGGRSNQVGAATEAGPAGVLLTQTAEYLVTDEVEAPRLLEEEVKGQSLELLSYPWYRTDPAEAVRRRVT